MTGMELDRLLARARGFEARVGSLYRTYATRMRDDPELCALWTALARDEERHAQTLEHAAGWLDRAKGWQTQLEGWDEALEEIEERLAEASRPEIGADANRMLIATLQLERTELDTIYERLVRLLGPPADLDHPEEHTRRLLACAARHADDLAVALEAGLLRARLYLRHAS